MLSTFFFLFLFVSSTSTLLLSEFYPYGPQVGDSTAPPNDDGSEGPLNLPNVFPYFDNNHRRIWISNNGLYSFLSAIPQFVPSPFPLANDSRLVAGFWTDIDTRGALNSSGNKLYYQIYGNTMLSNHTLSIFTKTSNYVRRFFPQQRLFEPKMVITATWYRVGAYPSQTNKLNTFQIVLSTDEDRSFVFFLYHDIQWTSRPDSPRSYAQAGFNAGDGITFETLPYSNTENISQLVEESNVNIPGLFVFRVDTEKIDAGGCNANVTLASFRPRISSQLGSTALNIQGPCFSNETVIKCRFDSSLEVVTGRVLNDFQAICLTPFASTHGRVPVQVSIDNGTTYIPAGFFTYAPLQFGSDEVTIETTDRDNLLNVGQNVALRWQFSEMLKNTFPNGTKIDIELWKVSLDSRSLLQKEDHIMLAQNLDLINSTFIQLPSSISYISTCFIRVVARFNAQIYAGLNTGILIVRSHSSLAPELCQSWAAQQPEPSTWNSDGLLPCPMTRLQAVSAGFCCYESDRQCYQGSSDPKNCWLHQARSDHNEPSAVQCYTSITSNRHGAGAECCYDNNGTIITRGTGAGTDDRYRPATAPVQHFFNDILPYLQCCIMSTNPGSCNRYMRYRPPRQGNNTRGDSGLMWGDPHFGTLDGASYTFNGYGEYTYLAISADTLNQPFVFTSQIRTIPLISSNVTVTKGFAARSNDANAESVSLTISRRENLILRRGNQTLEFDDNINTLYFPELTINRLDGNNNSHFSLSWNIGVTIQINLIKMISPSEQLVLNIAASVAGIFRNKTYGLLGTYDGIADNDLRNRNGTIINNNASLEQIHKEFGVTWAIDPSASLFYYELGQSAQFFREKNHEFIPPFMDPTNSTANNASIRSACQINATSSPSSWNPAQRACYYDLSMTNDLNFAQASLSAGNELLSMKSHARNYPYFPSSLPLRMDLKKGDSVSLNMSASSEYSRNIVVISALHLPPNAIFNNNTGIFTWTAVKGEEYVSIQAHDETYSLKTKHEITFNVDPGNGSGHQVSRAGSLIILVGLVVLLCQ